MLRLRRWIRLAPAVLLVFSISPLSTRAQNASSGSATGRQDPGTVAAGDEDEESDASPADSGSKEEPPKYPPYAQVLKDAKTIDGFLKLYLKEDRLYAELTSSHLDRDMIVVISIAKGIGQEPLLGGYSWGFDDDWVWQFHKVGDRIQIVRRNVRFTADHDSPEEKAVKLAYTDSILYSLPTVTIGPGGGTVVDLTPVFMSDLPQISSQLPGFSFSAARSTFAEVVGFRDNIELEVAATYGSGGTAVIDTVPDTRGATINVHYSISGLPNTGYKPRNADDRVGYFVTAIKDYSKNNDIDRFIRYVNRWDLKKADPDAAMSPPEKPIVFWLEKTIPFKYRVPIEQGILEWNKAFEKAGFFSAIQVRQQQESDTWDPEDIHYNTFRWITSSAGFAMGPSRVNPTNGQILDADIIFDADFLQYWKEEYETFTPDTIASLTGGPLTIFEYEEQEVRRHADHGDHHNWQCDMCIGMSQQFAMGAAVLAARKRSPEELEKLIMEGLKEVTMHEVGHTLGLRHNFKGSSAYQLKDLSDAAKASSTGLTASVMDYAPTYIVPDGMEQGAYFSNTIGPYDMWAIEFGYKPLSGGTDGEKDDLKKIAALSGKKEYAYGTDEDTRGIDPDPLANRWDMGENLVDYAKMEAKLVAEALPSVVDSMTEDGEGYQKARRAFGVLLSTHGQSMFAVARYIGGVYVSRSHKGDEDAPAPFEIVDAARQREALSLLEDEVFSDAPFHFPPDLYNHLAATRWSHWGIDLPTRTDYPVHDAILLWQERILSQLLSPTTLTRLHDSELKIDADRDALTTAELLSRLTKAIFSEVDGMNSGDYTNRSPAISSLRRNLQRSFMREMASLALGDTGAPEDCQTIAYEELSSLADRIETKLQSGMELDAYTRAHLDETQARIHKVLDARLTRSLP